MGPSNLHPTRSRLAWAIALALPLAPALHAGQSFDEFYVEIRGPEDMDASQKVSPLVSNNKVQQSVPAQPAIRTSSADKAGVYGPVRRGQTLWAVANAVRPAPSVTVQQTMLALYRKNPTAFAPGQLNNLYMGTFLRVPTLAEVQAEDEQTAFLSARRGRPIVAKPKPHNIPAHASSPKPVQQQSEPTPVPESASVKLSPTEETASAPSPAPQSHGEIISDRISIPAEATAQVAKPEPAMAVAEIPSRPETVAPSDNSGTVAQSDAGAVLQDTGSDISQEHGPVVDMAVAAVSAASAAPVDTHQVQPSDELAKLTESNAQLQLQLQQLSTEFNQLKGQLARANEPAGQPAAITPAWAAALASPLGVGVLFGLPTLLLLGLGMLWQRMRGLQRMQQQEVQPTIQPANPPTGMVQGLFAEPAVPFDMPAMQHDAAATKESLAPAGMNATRPLTSLLAEPRAEFRPEKAPVPFVEPEFSAVMTAEPDPGTQAGLQPFQAASTEEDVRPQPDSLEPDAVKRQEPVLPTASLVEPDVAESQAEGELQADWQSKITEPRAPLEFEGFSSLDAKLDQDANPEAGDIDTERSVEITPTDALGELAEQEEVELASAAADLDTVTGPADPEVLATEKPEALEFLDIDILLAEAEAAPEHSDESQLEAKVNELPSFEGLALEHTEPNNFTSEMDLARAYLEIDDNESARELLMQVLAQGSNKQKAEAQKLLKRLK